VNKCIRPLFALSILLLGLVDCDDLHHLTRLGQSDTQTTTVFESSTPTSLDPDLLSGQIASVVKPHGTYHFYLPTSLTASPDIIVLVHGTPAANETAAEDARFYIENWITVAEKQGAILIAPAFDQENFGGRDGPLGGYRGLFGRRIGADVFVIEIVNHYQRLFDATNARFYLYGHSAGGQFVARFIVKHPERIKRAVISAAATYPQPTPDIAWPHGMGELHTIIRWGDSESETTVEFNPDPAGWLAAATLPVTVVVGLNDLEPQPERVGQQGHTRVAIARNWVNAMNAYAAQHGVEGKMQLSMIPGSGHSSLGLLPHCQDALFPQSE
jgi:pimeloyl-ACP methyl ester carboxylesterase